MTDEVALLYCPPPLSVSLLRMTRVCLGCVCGCVMSRSARPACDVRHVGRLSWLTCHAGVCLCVCVREREREEAERERGRESERHTNIERDRERQRDREGER